MDFQEVVKGLSAEEISALKVLESSGWNIGLEVRVDDMKKPDGSRRRTFSNSGRYAVAAFLKNLSGRERVESPAFTSDVVQGLTAEAVPVVEIPPMVEEKKLEEPKVDGKKPDALPFLPPRNAEEVKPEEDAKKEPKVVPVIRHPSKGKRR